MQTFKHFHLNILTGNKSSTSSLTEPLRHKIDHKIAAIETELSPSLPFFYWTSKYQQVAPKHTSHKNSSSKFVT